MNIRAHNIAMNRVYEFRMLEARNAANYILGTKGTPAQRKALECALEYHMTHRVRLDTVKEYYELLGMHIPINERMGWTVDSYIQDYKKYFDRARNGNGALMRANSATVRALEKLGALTYDEDGGRSIDKVTLAYYPFGERDYIYNLKRVYAEAKQEEEARL